MRLNLPSSLLSVLLSTSLLIQDLSSWSSIHQKWPEPSIGQEVLYYYNVRELEQSHQEPPVAVFSLQSVWEAKVLSHQSEQTKLSISLKEANCSTLQLDATPLVRSFSDQQAQKTWCSFLVRHNFNNASKNGASFAKANEQFQKIWLTQTFFNRLQLQKGKKIPSELYSTQYNLKKAFSGFEHALSLAFTAWQSPSLASQSPVSDLYELSFSSTPSPAWNTNTLEGSIRLYQDSKNPLRQFLVRKHDLLVGEERHQIIETLFSIPK